MSAEDLRATWQALFAQACARIVSEGKTIEQARAILGDIVDLCEEYEIPFGEAIRSESAFIRSRYPDEWRGDYQARPGDSSRGSSPDSSPHGGDKKSANAKLLEIGLRAELFHDERCDAYAAVEDKGVRRILRVRSGSFRTWLAHSYYRETGKGANGEALATARGVCDAKAVLEGGRHSLDVRFARPSPFELWIDLCDAKWRAVKVTPEGWEIVEKPPFLFRRFSHQAPLPEPERGGDLRGVREFLNIGRDTEKEVLLQAWLLSVPLVDISRPALGLHGPQGSAKTTAARVVKGLLDPSAVANLVVGRDAGEMAQALDHHAVPFFDNLTKLHGWQADMLCRAVTGGGFSKRELYSDAEDVIFSFRRTILLTGINVPTTAPDLLDRFLLVGLDRVPPGSRKEETELWADFERERPRLFGGLLDALVETLRIYPSIRLTNLPRMADFARWGAAAAEALGFGSKAFLDAYRSNVSGVTEEVLEADLVAAAVRAFVEEHSEWSGTVSELLTAIDSRQSEAVRKSPDWPKDATRLSKRLRVVQTTLADAGVQVSFPERKTPKGHRTVEVRFLDPAAPAPPGSFDHTGLAFRCYPGATNNPALDLAPAVSGNGDGPPGASGATGAGFPHPTAPVAEVDEEELF
jgi:hypothetical protein